jgi:molecular chaperone GrpE
MKKKEKPTETTPTPESEVNDNLPPTLEQQILALKAEVDMWKNKHAMAYADMDNLRKAQEKSYLEALRYRSEGFIDNLIPALDAFHIALKNPVDDPKVKNYLVGFEYIYNQLQQAMENEGVKVIPIKVGDAFNVKTMNALEAVEDEGPPDRIIKILSPGYQLHDRVVKPALVVVSKKIEAKPTEEVDAKANGQEAA